jgi:hypothetical protein
MALAHLARPGKDEESLFGAGVGGGASRQFTSSTCSRTADRKPISSGPAGAASRRRPCNFKLTGSSLLAGPARPGGTRKARTAGAEPELQGEKVDYIVATSNACNHCRLVVTCQSPSKLDCCCANMGDNWNKSVRSPGEPWTGSCAEN